MNYLFVLSLIISALSTAIGLHLSPEQMYSTRGLLLKNTLTVGQKISVQKLLYKTHEKWAIKKAVEFKQLHRYKCTDISMDELILCGKIGLFRSCQNYNGRSTFTKYAEIYVKSELLRFMSARLAGAILQTVSNKSGSIKKRANYKALLDRMETHPELASNPSFGGEEGGPSSQYNTHNRLCNSMWQHINEQDGFTQRVFWYKYDCDFAQIRSNKQVAELMCCSEETVRKTVQRENENIRNRIVKIL